MCLKIKNNQPLFLCHLAEFVNFDFENKMRHNLSFVLYYSQSADNGSNGKHTYAQ